MFRTVSQIAINYRDSPLSQGAAGRVQGGDRLPWVPLKGATIDNFVPLASLDWQAHVYGACNSILAEFCHQQGLALHTFPWKPAAARAGFQQGALYLVRPDGYTALADPDASPVALEHYLNTRRIRSLGPSQNSSQNP